MTEQPTALPGPGTATYPLLDPDVDPSGVLNVIELDAASQSIRADVLTACQPGHPRRAISLAALTWQLARRQDAKLRLVDFTRLTVSELSDLLWPTVDLDDDEDQGDDVDQVDQVDHVEWTPGLADDDDQGDVDPDAALAAQDVDPLDAELAARPTDPAPAP